MAKRCLLDDESTDVGGFIESRWFCIVVWREQATSRKPCSQPAPPPPHVEGRGRACRYDTSRRK